MLQLVKKSSLLAALSVITLPAFADICITFGNSVDDFEGKLMAQGRGFSSVSMLETTFNRAASGSSKRIGSTLYLGWTKNTSTASVQYQCQIDTVQKNGPCSIMVFSSEPVDTSRSDDVAFVEMGSCITPNQTPNQAHTLLPPGEVR
jgi:hypothetical protein